jgi:hypothetical protein
MHEMKAESDVMCKSKLYNAPMISLHFCPEIHKTPAMHAPTQNASARARAHVNSASTLATQSWHPCACHSPRQFLQTPPDVPRLPLQHPYALKEEVIALQLSRALDAENEMIPHSA